MVFAGIFLGILGISASAFAQYSCDKPEDRVDGKNFRFVRCYADPSDPTTRMVSMTVSVDPGRSSPPVEISIRTRTSFQEQQRHHDRANTFMMNGPMFNPDGSPVGLVVSDGKLLGPFNPASGGNGNFFGISSPTFENNGVIAVLKDGSTKFMTRSEAESFFRDPGRVSAVKMAFQGGPILVKDGKINDALGPNSTNVKQRSAVCITSRGKLRFMTTNHVPPASADGSQPEGGMTFYKFAKGGLDSKCIQEKDGTPDPCVSTLFVDGSKGVVDSDFPAGSLNSDSPSRKNVFVLKLNP